MRRMRIFQALKCTPQTRASSQPETGRLTGAGARFPAPCIAAQPIAGLRIALGHTLPPLLLLMASVLLPCLALPCLCFFWPPLCSREPPSNVRLSHAGTGIPPQLRARFSSPPGPAAGSRRARTRPCFPQRPRRRLLLRDLPAARLPLASQAKAGRHICLTFRSFWTAFCSARHSFRAAPRLVRLILPTWATGAAVALFLASPFPLTAARAEPLFSPAWDAEKESARGILVGPLSPHA
jgi:hypothetical protein